jgi:predicted nicotinamide N-methyase
VDLVDEVLSLGSRELSLLRPRRADDLLDEDAFAADEFLPYWAELWPSALALARLVGTMPLATARVVELGCGLGLPSIAAALRGASVLATDWSPDALRFVGLNAARNRARVETAFCDWARPDAVVARGPFDLVLASDVLYEPRNGGLLLDLLPRLVEAGGEVLLADPGRPALAGFLADARSAWTVDSWVAPETRSVELHRLRTPRQ